MSLAPALPKQRHRVYPAKYFGASPTYDHWCKLSALDIHALRAEAGFEGQNVFFYLNHPIRYAYIVAPIVSIEDFNHKTVVITLDDSSGACVDLRLSWNVDKDDALKTSVPNLSVFSGLGDFTIRISDQQIGIGTIVKAKGTFTSFRGTRQIELKRISVVKDTPEEVEAWASAAQFKRDVLSKSWALPEQARQAIDQRLVDDQRRIRYENKRRQLHAQKQAKREEQREMRHEKRRQIAERDMNAGALI